MRSHVICLLTIAVATASQSPAAGAAPSPAAERREFDLTYAVAVDGLKPGAKARVWLPVAPSDAFQTVKIIKRDFPGEPSTAVESKYGNRILYFEASARRDGRLTGKITYHVVRALAGTDEVTPVSSDEAGRDLQPDQLVPIDGKPLKLLNDRRLPADRLQKARALYDLVLDQMQYSKEGAGWGQGDVNWVCDHRYGNCSDFHSLFIALARSQQIPARFEIGFALPVASTDDEITAYHCWAKFLDDAHHWRPVDLAEAKKHPELRDSYFGQLTANRVMFSVGRDLTLVPKQSGAPLNFFIYPYVEVDGKAYPAGKIATTVSYTDRPPRGRSDASSNPPSMAKPKANQATRPRVDRPAKLSDQP